MFTEEDIEREAKAQRESLELLAAMNERSKLRYMLYEYAPQEDVDDDVTKIMHTIKCQVTGEVVWYDTRHSPYSYLSRDEFVEFIDSKLHGETEKRET